MDSFSQAGPNLADEVQQEHWTIETGILWKEANNNDEDPFEFQTIDDIIEEMEVCQEELESCKEILSACNTANDKIDGEIQFCEDKNVELRENMCVGCNFKSNIFTDSNFNDNIDLATK